MINSPAQRLTSPQPVQTTNLPVFNPMILPKPANTTRVYMLNIHGIQVDSQGGSWAPTLAQIQESEIDVFGASEVNLDTNQYIPRQLLHDTCRKRFPTHVLVTGTTPVRSHTQYKPGGVLLLTNGPPTSRIISKGSDHLGRWAYITYGRKRTTPVTIVTIYQPTLQYSGGTTTATNQQRAILDTIAITQNQERRTPRQAFQHDLHSFISDLHQEGHTIVLGGDFNAQLGRNITPIEQMAAECGLSDIMTEKHNKPNYPPTYTRGKSRLDYFLISTSLIPAVKRCGYEAYNASFPSDHRGMYLDFDSKALFNCVPIPLPPPEQRDFTTQNRKVLLAYIAEKHRQCVAHNIPERLSQIQQATVFQPEKLEAIDRDLVRSSLAAANKCKPVKRPPWSPKIARAWAKQMFYHMAISSHKSNIDNSAAIQKYRELSGQPLVLPTTLEETLNAARSAKKELKILRKQAQELREQHLQTLVDNAAPNEQSDRRKLLQRIQKPEEIKAMYRKIRRIRGSVRQTITQLKVPTDPKADPKTWTGEWSILDSPDEIQARIVQHNKKHFSQAQGTPMTSATMNDRIGYIANPEAARAILAGNFQIDHQNPAAEMFLQELKSQVPEESPADIQLEDFRRRLRRWRESTTTSPSGVHLGHYRALVVPTHDEDTAQKQEQLLTLQLGVLNLAIKHGYPLKRWKQVLNVMIPKDPGIPKFIDFA